MPGSLSSFVSRSFSWLSAGGLRPVDGQVEQSTAASQEQSGAGEAVAAVSSAALPPPVVPLGHLGGLPAPYPAPNVFAGPHVAPLVHEAEDLLELSRAQAADALHSFSMAHDQHLPPVPRRSGPPSASTLQSGDFMSLSSGVASSPPSNGGNASSPRRTQTSHLRSFEEAQRRHQNHASYDQDIGFPQGPFATIGAHVDRISAYASNPSLGGGIFQIRHKEGQPQGTKHVGPTLRLVCSREGKSRSSSGAGGSNSQVEAAASASSAPSRRRASLRCGCLWSVRLEVVSLPHVPLPLADGTVPDLIPAVGYSGYVSHFLPLPHPPTTSHALHGCLFSSGPWLSKPIWFIITLCQRMFSLLFLLRIIIQFQQIFVSMLKT